LEIKKEHVRAVYSLCNLVDPAKRDVIVGGIDFWSLEQQEQKQNAETQTSLFLQ
jgi:hypothetical protein